MNGNLENESHEQRLLCLEASQKWRKASGWKGTKVWGRVHWAYYLGCQIQCSLPRSPQHYCYSLYRNGHDWSKDRHSTYGRPSVGCVANRWPDIKHIDASQHVIQRRSFQILDGGIRKRVTNQKWEKSRCTSSQFLFLFAFWFWF